MLKKTKTSLLEIAYKEKGDANGAPIILMHGFSRRRENVERRHRVKNPQR